MADNFIDHVSHSQLSLWEKCPRAWEYRYIERIKTPTSCNLVFGDVYHHALELFYTNKLQTGEEYCEEVMKDVVSAYWNKCVDEKDIIWKKDSPEDMLQTCTNLILLYIDEIAPVITPKKVEEWFYGDIDGTKFVLRMDLMEESGAIIDHKTAGKSYTQDRVDKDDQATACAFVLERPIVFYNHVAVKTKKPKVQIFKTLRRTEDVLWWYEKARLIIGCMKSGLCPPRSDTWFCSSEFCDFYDRCRGDLSTLF